MTTQTIDRDAVQALSVPSKSRTFADSVLTWGIIAGAAAAAHLVDRAYAYLLAIIIIGGRQNALATLAHEGWHGLLFRSRRANHAIAAWFYAYPLGILYYHDRERHLRHHREVGHDYDPDWINYTSRDRETPARLLAYLASLLFGRLLFSTLLSVAKRGRPRITIESANVPSELWRVAVSQGVLFGAMTAATGQWWVYPLLWLLPLATFAGFFANFRALIEHVVVCDDATPEDRLRDIHAGPLERFFVAPSHFNYHALHHAHPSVPHYNLPRGKEAYLQRFGLYPFTVRPGYTNAFFAHLRQLRPQA
ncbi:MAG TPA: fatty acid desaturase family protein [Terriglobia bacterium]|jgi:fatty acid desaturase